MSQSLVVELLQRVSRALLLLIVAPEFQQLQFAQRVIEIPGVKRATDGFQIGVLGIFSWNGEG